MCRALCRLTWPRRLATPSSIGWRPCRDRLERDVVCSSQAHGDMRPVSFLFLMMRIRPVVGQASCLSARRTSKGSRNRLEACSTIGFTLIAGEQNACDHLRFDARQSRHSAQYGPFTDRYGGVPKDLNLAGSRVFCCPSDRFNSPTNGIITTNTYCTYTASSWVNGPQTGNSVCQRVGGQERRAFRFPLESPARELRTTHHS